MDHRHVEIDRAVEQLLVRMAEENRSRGYDRIVGAFAGLRHEVSDYTVGNVLRPSRHTSCAEAQAHDDLADLHSGAFRKVGEDGFFSAEVLTPHGLVTYYLLFFIHLARRRVEIAWDPHPSNPSSGCSKCKWLETWEGCGARRDCRCLLDGRDTK